MHNVQGLLESFFESKVTQFECDLFKNRVSIQCQTTEYSEHQIALSDVSCLYFINNDTDHRLNILEFDDDDYVELTSIYILDDSVRFHLLSEETWVNSYRGYGNILIELWSKILIIESKTITIDGIDYRI
ncbi:hypothetical protein BU202_00055 [Streptococcus cuniculi]|uniref:Uncharacterized protein n=1 Tax=Streptococcus cuniculi TaxID=1432788 RepID=A0A1Q8EAA0_9STRE|nr:hypothetical protein BU202_00055 [Streptococcus cuniculi]